VCSSLITYFILRNADLATMSGKGDIKTPSYAEFSVHHKLKMRLWQAICVIAPFVNDKAAATAAASVLESVRRHSLD